MLADLKTSHLSEKELKHLLKTAQFEFQMGRLLVGGEARGTGIRNILQIVRLTFSRSRSSRDLLNYIVKVLSTAFLFGVWGEITRPYPLEITNLGPFFHPWDLINILKNDVFSAEALSAECLVRVAKTFKDDIEYYGILGAAYATGVTHVVGFLALYDCMRNRCLLPAFKISFVRYGIASIVVVLLSYSYTPAGLLIIPYGAGLLLSFYGVLVLLGEISLHQLRQTIGMRLWPS